MRRALRSGLLVPFALALLLAASARAGLRTEIEYAIASGNLDNAKVAVSVIEAGPGSILPLVEIDAGALMIPASNMKLLTSGAALHTLGRDFSFRTRLLLNRDRLVVVGDGDPGFGDPELLALMVPDGAASPGMDLTAFVGIWVDAVVDQGIDRISEVIVDDTVFDRELVHETWPIDQLNRSYCAQASGLVFHLNRLHFFPEPQPGGRPSLAIYQPRITTLSPVNNATSRTGVHDDDTVWIARRLGTNDLTFYGNVKHLYRTPVPVTVHDMPAVYGDLLADRLRRAGLSVGPARLARTEETGWTGLPVGPVIRTPIATAITRCNRDSQNLYAECLLKRIGREMTGQPGSWLNGAAIILRHVVHDRLETPRLSSKLLVADGSGLSRRNRVAPATITAWLNTFHNDETLGPTFIESLAVGGESGTLKKRLRADELDGAVVQGKSGYIDGVSCLSGFVTSPDGRRRCFSVMINDLRVSVRRAKSLQNEIVTLIARDMIATPITLGSD